MRRPVIAGNWKMNKTVDEAIQLVNDLKERVKGAEAEVVICPTFVCLQPVKEALKGTDIKIGAQNMHWEENGAFTGEVSPTMLKELGIDYVIIGHSERRQYYAETDQTVNKKILSAFEHDIIPILCVGETLEQREKGETKSVVERQTQKALQGLTAEQTKGMIIAYEPIWAIGTGRTASSQDANEVIGFIRETVSEMFGNDVAANIRIQYGGSVKPSNIKELMSMPHIDGALVGGASLNAEDFEGIVNF
ncbi:MAG: triose-phosphate isomerase [Clostridia bacterium]|nr:triose-phosphate isomerase [Clostridia bacterium]